MSSNKIPLSEIRFPDSGVWEPGRTNQFRAHYTDDNYSLTLDRETSELMIIDKSGAHRAMHSSRALNYSYKVAPANPFKADRPELAKAVR